MRIFGLIICLFLFVSANAQTKTRTWIRINQLGYPSQSVKVAVLVSKGKHSIDNFELVDAKTSRSVLKKKAGKDFGAYGPFTSSYRLDFSEYNGAGVRMPQRAPRRS